MRRWALPLLFLAAYGCKAKEAENSILLITIDTLRADHLKTYGYFRDTSPHIDAFAAENVLFENTVTPMATTLPAHVSMMTSTRPMRHGVVRNGLRFEPEVDLRTIAQMLGARGYRTAAFVSAAPVSKGTGIEVGFSHFDDPKRNTRRAEKTTDRVLAWFEERASEGKAKETPFFVWVHYWDPHGPYTPPKAYRSRFEKTDALESFVRGTGTKLEHEVGKVTFDVLDINNRYDAEIAYTDAEIGRLFEGLRKVGVYDEATVVLTADHGEGLWQHDWHDHGRIWNEQLFVPLVVKAPKSRDMEPRRVESIASTLDVMTTVDGLLELPLTDDDRKQFEGVDLFGKAEPRTSVFSERVNVHRRGWEEGDKYALTTLRWKYFALTEGEDQLFDMTKDRLELHDVIEENPRVATSMKRQVGSIIASYVERRAAPRKTVDSELVEKLRALGYMQ